MVLRPWPIGYCALYPSPFINGYLIFLMSKGVVELQLILPNVILFFECSDDIIKPMPLDYGATILTTCRPHDWANSMGTFLVELKCFGDLLRRS